MASRSHGCSRVPRNDSSGRICLEMNRAIIIRIEVGIERQDRLPKSASHMGGAAMLANGQARTVLISIVRSSRVILESSHYSLFEYQVPCHFHAYTSKSTSRLDTFRHVGLGALLGL